MALELPRIVQDYIDASNRHDVKSIVACFSDDATVHDEGEILRGKKAIEGWVVKTIEAYAFQFKPLSVRDGSSDVIVTVEVSGTFDGSPVRPEYRFTLASDKISSLHID